MAPANNKANLKAEIERKLEKENLERRLRLERERKPVEVPGVKIPQFLTRNSLAKDLTKLNVPNLLPLRDAILSLSDPGFLNKKFNQDVYRELPQRVKDFIALPANQVTRAVIISKIIEAVKIAKKNAGNKNFNLGVAKALVNVAPKPRATTNASTNTGINATNKLNKASLTVINEIEKAKNISAPPPPPPPPKVALPPLKINENAAKKGLAKNAAEGAAQGAKNRQIRLIRNKLNQLKNKNLTSEFNKILAGNPNINTLLEFNGKLNSQGTKKIINNDNGY
jgi:hypothetical protein